MLKQQSNRTVWMVLIIVMTSAALMLTACPIEPPGDDENGDDDDGSTTTYAVIVTPIGADSGESVTADVSEAAEGDTVTLTAALNSGRQVSLSASGVTISPSTISTDGGTATFTMPAAAVGVAAMFSDIMPAEENGFTGTLAIGDEGTLTLTESGESITMIYAQDQSSISFPSDDGSGGPDYDDGSATLNKQFFMAETEVTNAVVAAVLQWAYDEDWFSSSGHNELSPSTVKYGNQELLDLDDSDCRVDYDGSGTFSAQSGYEHNPVTDISWYGAIMICNWLTEMRDGNTDNVVYTSIDTSWTDDETIENISRNGYRLPSRDEWEYAARYRGTDTTNTVSGYSNPYFTQGDSASGATADYNNASACQAVAVYSGQNPAPTDEEAVKSLGSGSENTLGLYDMSGNVREWCFTESGSGRIKRGGSWAVDAGFLQAGYWFHYTPDLTFGDLGFRVCRTAD